VSAGAGAGVVILLVEDNPADVFFFTEALEASGAAATVHVASNGDEALAFLRREGPWADAPRPGIVVLDLNLPVRTGWETLLEISGDRALSDIPTVILTTSGAESTAGARHTGESCRFFTKTHDFARLQQIVRDIVALARPR
jgi:CheY-like chemotaxis protein